MNHQKRERMSLDGVDESEELLVAMMEILRYVLLY